MMEFFKIEFTMTRYIPLYLQLLTKRSKSPDKEYGVAYYSTCNMFILIQTHLVGKYGVFISVGVLYSQVMVITQRLKLRSGGLIEVKQKDIMFFNVVIY
jgi:hypothetical protein